MNSQHPGTASQPSSHDTRLRFALFGAGFWAGYQLAGWLETGAVECVAICDIDSERARALADRHGIVRVYSDAVALLDAETIDFIDVCTPVETHPVYVALACDRGLPVVCQKPMAPSLEQARQMVQTCQRAGVPLFINENWRWQEPIRQVKTVLDSGAIGRPFRARIDYRNSFPVFDNQPFLKELTHFILTDMGSHILDVARFLFGEASSLVCHAQRIHADIAGEDVATVMMTMDASSATVTSDQPADVRPGDALPAADEPLGTEASNGQTASSHLLAASGMTVVCEMSYATRREHDRFPETYIQIEGSDGFLELSPDFWLRLTTADGTQAWRIVPRHYNWADPAYDVIHSSIVPTQLDFVRAMHGDHAAETTGADNLRTMQLIFAAYQSAQHRQIVDPRTL